MQTQVMPAQESAVAYLETATDSSIAPARTVVDDLPFTIGRASTCGLQIHLHHVSREHALIWSDGGAHVLRDLESTNGTQVNRQRIEECPLQDGDEIGIGGITFTFRICDERRERTDATEVLSRDADRNSQSFAGIKQQLRWMQEVVLHRGLEVELEPVVRFSSGEVIAYEARRRSRRELNGKRAPQLAPIKGQSHFSRRLNEIYRSVAVERFHQLSKNCQLILEVDEWELEFLDQLTMHLADIREPFEVPGDLCVSAPVAEPTLNDAHGLVEYLKDQQIGLAFHDFVGSRADAAKLLEFGPRWLLLGHAMIKDLSSRASLRQELSAVVDACREANCFAVATRARSPHVQEICQQAGVDYFQSLQSTPGKTH